MLLLERLEFSFSPLITRDRHNPMIDLFRDTVLYLDEYFRGVIAKCPVLLLPRMYEYNESHLQLLQVLNLDTVSFLALRTSEYYFIECLPKFDEKKLVFMAILLHLLRHYIPVKYATMEIFLVDYSCFSNKTTKELENLKLFANWTNLILYTIHPKDSLVFMFDLVCRLCEGRYVIYALGSAQSVEASAREFILKQESSRVPDKASPGPSAAAGASGREKTAVDVDTEAYRFKMAHFGASVNDSFVLRPQDAHTHQKDAHTHIHDGGGSAVNGMSLLGSVCSDMLPSIC